MDYHIGENQEPRGVEEVDCKIHSGAPTGEGEDWAKGSAHLHCQKAPVTYAGMWPCRNYPPRSLSPALMTGLDGEPSPDTPWTLSRRGAAHRSRRPGKEERRRLMLPAIPVSSHARTVPGPASLGSDSTATSVPMADGSNAEDCYRSRWTTTRFKSRSELERLGFSAWYFLDIVVEGFLRVLRFSPLFHRLMASVDEVKPK